MPPGMALIVTLRGSNYRCLEEIFMVPKGFEPLKFDCMLPTAVGDGVWQNAVSHKQLDKS